MLLDVNYKFLGNINVTNTVIKLAEEVGKIDWYSSDYQRLEPALKDGKIIEFPYVVAHSKLDQNEHRYITQDLSKEIVDRVSELYPNCVFVRGEISALLPEIKILPHIDGKWFHEFSHRVHVPLITNARCMNVFKNEKIHFDTFSIFEINNRVMHHAYNQGTEPRVHLIFDLMPEHIFNSTNKSMFDVRTSKY
jgi:hypothetical protein